MLMKFIEYFSVTSHYKLLVKNDNYKIYQEKIIIQITNVINILLFIFR